MHGGFGCTERRTSDHVGFIGHHGTIEEYALWLAITSPFQWKMNPAKSSISILGMGSAPKQHCFKLYIGLAHMAQSQKKVSTPSKAPWHPTFHRQYKLYKLAVNPFPHTRLKYYPPILQPITHPAMTVIKTYPSPFQTVISNAERMLFDEKGWVGASTRKHVPGFDSLGQPQLTLLELEPTRTQNVDLRTRTSTPATCKFGLLVDNAHLHSPHWNHKILPPSIHPQPFPSPKPLLLPSTLLQNGIQDK